MLIMPIWMFYRITILYHNLEDVLKYVVLEGNAATCR